MPRIAADFSEEITALLEKYQKEKGLSSIAQSLREVVEVGLKIKENLSKKYDSEAQKNDYFYESLTQTNQVLAEVLTMKKLLNENSEWTMESRLLNRFLVANMPGQSKEIGIEILQKIKEKSQGFVKKILAGHVSVPNNSTLKQ